MLRIWISTHHYSLPHHSLLRHTAIILLLFWLFPHHNALAMSTTDSALAQDEAYAALQHYQALGRVTAILEEVKGIDYGAQLVGDRQLVEITILSGPLRGSSVEVSHTYFGHPLFDLWVKPGDRLVLSISETLSGPPEIGISGYARDRYLYVLVGLFVLMLLLVGGRQGIKAIVTLGLTLFLIIKVLLPLLLLGYPPVLLALLIGLLVSTLTFWIISGWTVKSAAAILGTLGGLTVAALLSIVVVHFARLSGLSGEEEQMLLHLGQDIQFDFRGLLLAGILIGALGAVMDVAMSIASAMQEVHDKNPRLRFAELYRSGLSVGRDIMGTMSNTLILAYTGTSIPLLLLLIAHEKPLLDIVNTDFLLTEVLRAMSGSIGLILVIPLTALLTALLLKRR